MRVLSIDEYLELHDKDYGPFPVNELATPVDPLGGDWHMNQRKVVDLESGTVTLYDIEEEEWLQKPLQSATQ